MTTVAVPTRHFLALSATALTLCACAQPAADDDDGERKHDSATTSGEARPDAAVEEEPGAAYPEAAASHTTNTEAGRPRLTEAEASVGVIEGGSVTVVDSAAYGEAGAEDDSMIDAASVDVDSSAPVLPDGSGGQSSNPEECYHECDLFNHECPWQVEPYVETRARLVMDSETCTGPAFPFQAYGGSCSGDRLFLVMFDQTYVARVYDSSGAFLGLTAGDDDIDVPCEAYYRPEPTTCEDAVVEEVFCGDVEPGARVSFPYWEE